MVNESNIQIEEPKLIKDEKSAESKNIERVLKVFSFIVGIIGIVALIWIKIINPAFPLIWVIIIGVFLVLVSVLMFFAFVIYRKFTEEKDETKDYKGRLPKPASLASLRETCDDVLTNTHFVNHGTGCVHEQYFNAGKHGERIYVYVTHALYKEHPNGQSMDKGRIVIIINSHYPEDLRTVLIDPTPTEFHRAVNSIVTEKEELPEESTRTELEYSPVTGGFKEVTQDTKKRKEEPKKEEKEDLK